MGGKSGSGVLFDLPSQISGTGPGYQAPSGPSGDVAKRAFEESQAGSPEQYAAGLMKEAGKAESMITPLAQMQGQEAGMGMQNQAQLAAIHGKAKNYFNAQKNAIGMQAQLKGLDKDQQLRMRAFDHVHRMNNVTQEMYKRRMAEESNRQATRNQVIGSIFGAAGAIGGAIVGGPAGASVGSHIGGAMTPGGTEMTQMGEK